MSIPVIPFTPVVEISDSIDKKIDILLNHPSIIELINENKTSDLKNSIDETFLLRVNEDNLRKQINNQNKIIKFQRDNLRRRFRNITNKKKENILLAELIHDMTKEQSQKNPKYINVEFEYESDKYIPIYKTPGAACCDLKSYGDHEIQSGQTLKIYSGVTIKKIPDNYFLKVHARSGHFVRGLNVTGIIDNDYSLTNDLDAKIFIMIQNNSNRTYVIKDADCIAQMEIAKLKRITTIGNAMQKRGKGFGSSGR